MPNAINPEPLTCGLCNGTGSLHRRTCPDCSGRGDVSCHICPHHEPATRTAAGDADIVLCAKCGEQSDEDYAAYLASELGAA